jgi:hypothetical protein
MSGPLGGETITILEAALEPGSHGTMHRDWNNAITTTVSGCSVQPFSAEEVIADREFTATRMKLFAPFDTFLDATCRVVHQGVTYEVDGQPAAWRDDMGVPDHLEAVLKRLAG